MYDLKTGIGNIGVGAGSLTRASNRPKQFDDRKNPYFADATGRFIAEYARFATNHTAARMQGLNGADFYAWSDQLLRLADVNKRGGAIDRPTDGYKEFLVEAHEIEYVPEGAKVETMGSTWLVTNPANISGAVGSMEPPGLVRQLKKGTDGCGESGHERHGQRLSGNGAADAGLFQHYHAV